MSSSAYVASTHISDLLKMVMIINFQLIQCCTACSTWSENAFQYSMVMISFVLFIILWVDKPYKIFQAFLVIIQVVLVSVLLTLAPLLALFYFFNYLEQSRPDFSSFQKGRSLSVNLLV